MLVKFYQPQNIVGFHIYIRFWFTTAAHKDGDKKITPSAFQSVENSNAPSPAGLRNLRAALMVRECPTAY